MDIISVSCPCGRTYRVSDQHGGKRIRCKGCGHAFDVPAAKMHIMTTEGPSDTVLTLHGPNDPGAVLAWDDDRGTGLNARIVRKLAAGSYWLSVRHKSPAGTGEYTIGVKAQR